jgi:hypothetical protein
MHARRESATVLRSAHALEVDVRLSVRVEEAVAAETAPHVATRAGADVGKADADGNPNESLHGPSWAAVGAT